MKLKQRIAYYLGGFTIGLILLFFFLGGKKTSCDYGMDARTLKDIRIKKRFFSENTLQTLATHNLDTSAISLLLKKGDVVFGESNTKLDSCKLYVIVGTVSDKKLKITAENCSKKATILKTEIFSR
ncbi:hypothetical protein ATE92_2266 [Ulvibacter sp. MAR_2010_11]|uniref:DUF4258 domain-containing protein n=1 Tax=Ulvibacter sp. MAR_2010_11 TaxID=1250229 RepID=UPI000C2B6067|nr:DUF4258 domain-containing protein [Ulvibacter sp. MAR_2010_11]PKA84096.1 hypothetical protein ATE92_2266 [Ulvibacter sp. MAR_2010_11]